MKCDVYLVGVGGQGVLTIGEILTEAAQLVGIPASFYPTKGMAQRGGFVKAQLRLGGENRGVSIAERGADLVIAMERSEALKAVRYIRPGGEFLLYDQVWEPTAVLLGKATYPGEADVLGQIQDAGATVQQLNPATLPRHEGQPVRDNIYVLGAAIACSPLHEMLPADTVLDIIESRWEHGAESNKLAFKAGMRSV